MTDIPADDTNEQRAVRLAKRARLLERGEQAYPVSVPVTDTIAAVSARHADLRRTPRPARSSGSPAGSSTSATPASSASPRCRRATAAASRPW